MCGAFVTKAGGELAQQIAIQLDAETALRTLYAKMHGCAICINSDNLIAEACSIHPQAASAGPNANNFAFAPGYASGSSPVGEGSCP